ncbi:hypothetical protein RhiirA5_377825 [Rhizophagus irregularis]|uniref:Uncharacterized protein n=1 Tax=Rhizophagus irregularis TaxID=588596 RepID=A0A2N0PI16_9GLOM|nr:hypothetical protein RhiirA5_377825 [Rhizophagus irregularis]
MRRKLDQASSSSQSATLEADIVEIVTERKVIHFSADEDLLSIIWIANLKLWIRADSYVNYHVLRLEDNILHQSEQVRSPIYLDHVVVSKISLLIDKTRKLRICFLVFWPSDWNFYTVSSIVEVKKYRIDIFCELNSIQYDVRDGFIPSPNECIEKKYFDPLGNFNNYYLTELRSPNWRKAN